MKKLLGLILLLFMSCAAHATTWYATSSSVGIDTASLWVPTSTGSCTGSGTALVWGAQANGDVFDANGCTALAVDVDPGAATGASAGVCGTVTVTVTLNTDATLGGAFTYATSTNIVIHAGVTAGTTTALTVTGSTGGLTICGSIIGGTVTSKFGVSDSHTLVTVYVIGNTTGGSAGSSNGYNQSGNGPVNLTGTATAGSSTGGGISVAGNGVFVVTGNCVGSNTTSAVGCGVGGNGNAIALTGNIINGNKGPGTSGPVIYTPAATNYILYPKDSSYTLGTINSHATLMPTDPGSTNVKTGVVYGPNTGSYGGGTSAGQGYAY